MGTKDWIYSPASLKKLMKVGNQLEFNLFHWTKYVVFIWKNHFLSYLCQCENIICTIMFNFEFYKIASVVLVGLCVLTVVVV